MIALSALFGLITVGAVATSPQDCRAITDSAARLACYDAREAKPASASSLEMPSTRPAPGYAPSAPQPTAASNASIVRSDPTGRVTSVTARRYGLFRLTLDDGRTFDTATNTNAPPVVGDSVRLRRTPIGTTFLDIPGRSPVTVRLVRQ